MGVSVQLAKSLLDGGEALQFPMEIRHRELKRASMDSHIESFVDCFNPKV